MFNNKTIKSFLFFLIIKKLIEFMRKKIPAEDKRKSITFSIKPEIYEMWQKYCKESGIDNYSEYIEKIIIEKLNIKK